MYESASLRANKAPPLRSRRLMRNVSAVPECDVMSGEAMRIYHAIWLPEIDDKLYHKHGEQHISFEHVRRNGRLLGYS